MFNTPHYLLHEPALKRNLEKVKQLKEGTDKIKVLLALKCFSNPCFFPLMRNYLDGTTTSSINEVRLGDSFNKENHAYSVAYSDEDIRYINEINPDKLIFNSLSQLHQYRMRLNKNIQVGIRINPGVSFSSYDLANPNRPMSRLGVSTDDVYELNRSHPQLPPQLSRYGISGAMLHFNCDNNSNWYIKKHLEFILDRLGYFLKKLSWISLGGGVAFTDPDFDLKQYKQDLLNFSKECNNATIYLEPGEALMKNVGELKVKVLDIINNKIAVVDASVEAHMLDILTYRLMDDVDMHLPNHYIIAGRSCLAGDEFGRMGFNKLLKVGDIITLKDTKKYTIAGYSMVKKNWFNGVDMPSIIVKRLNNKKELIKQFTYEDFLSSHTDIERI